MVAAPIGMRGAGIAEKVAQREPDNPGTGVINRIVVGPGMGEAVEVIDGVHEEALFALQTGLYSRQHLPARTPPARLTKYSKTASSSVGSIFTAASACASRACRFRSSWVCQSQGGTARAARQFRLGLPAANRHLVEPAGGRARLGFAQQTGQFLPCLPGRLIELADLAADHKAFVACRLAGRLTARDPHGDFDRRFREGLAATIAFAEMEFDGGIGLRRKLPAAAQPAQAHQQQQRFLFRTGRFQVADRCKLRRAGQGRGEHLFQPLGQGRRAIVEFLVRRSQATHLLFVLIRAAYLFKAARH